MAYRDFTHQRPLAAIAIATATENDGQTGAARAGHRPQGRKALSRASGVCA
jgi:hypothetical protein